MKELLQQRLTSLIARAARINDSIDQAQDCIDYWINNRNQSAEASSRELCDKWEAELELVLAEVQRLEDALA